MANLGCLPQEKPAATGSGYKPTVHAGCFSVSIIHQTLTWTTGSLTCAQIWVYGHCKRVCTKKKLTLGEKSLVAPGNQVCIGDVPV